MQSSYIFLKTLLYGMQELGSGKWGKITRFAQVNINSKLQSWAFNPVWFHVYYRV